jgi:hypothetical protein
MQRGCHRHASDEGCRCRRSTRADPGSEVTLHPCRYLWGASIPLETLEVEAQVAGRLPEMGVIRPPSVGEESVDYGPESVL